MLIYGGCKNVWNLKSDSNSLNNPAAQLAGAAEQLRDSFNYHIEPAERRFREAYLESTRPLLSEADFAEAYGEGCKLKLDKAVALALSGSSTNSKQ